MSTVSIAEAAGSWVVTAETQTVGQLQRYHCPTQAIAQRWASLLGAPRKATMATPVRLRAPQPSEDEGLTYTVTWVGAHEVAGVR